MKLLPILAAAAAAALAIPAAGAVAAPAAPAIAAKADIQHHRPHARKRVYYRTVCTTKWRHGHRYRDCRKVRYYR
jgi:hypothetical protein